MGSEKQKMILLVEDEAITAMAEKIALKKYGYKVITANSGEEAVATVEKTPAIDLVLMDIDLGVGIDGAEAAAIILRKHDIPVVFLFSPTDQEMVAKTEKISPYGYVLKNSGDTILQASIKMAFKFFESKTMAKEKKALQESEEWNKVILQTVLSGVMVIDVATRKIVEVNDTALKLIGLPKEQVVGFVCHRFVCPAEEKNCPILDFGKEVDFSEKILLTADGKRKNVIKTVVPVQLHGREYLIESFVDITERKLAEEALAQERFLMQALMNNIPDYVYFKNRDSRLIRISKAHAQSFGMSDPVQAIGKTDFDFFTEEHARQAFEDEQDIIRTGQPVSKVEKETRADRPDAWVSTTKMPLCDEQGNIIGTFGISRDITQRKLVEEEIKRQLSEKEILLREVHHRIKNNIASISGLISLHMQSVTNPEAIAVLQDAIGRINSMRILYDKLLLSEDYKDVSVKNYVENLSDLVVALFPDSAKVTLDKRIADFHLDPKQLVPLGIIINELLTNKMKYAFINRDTGLIKISLTNVNNHVTLTMHDNGNGLPDLFDINESKGFGLTLVKMLTRQLGGSFSMEKHAGTRCTLEFDI